VEENGPGGGNGGSVPDLSGLGMDNPHAMDPKLHMEYAEVRGLGENVAGQGQNLDTMSGRLKGLDLNVYTFGLVGGPLNAAHDHFRDSATKALDQGKEVLKSWQEALRAAASHTEEAEKASSAPKDPSGLPLGPGFDPSGLGLPPDGLGLPDAGGLNPDGSDLNGLDPDGLNPDGLNPDGTDPNGLNPNGLDPNSLNPNGLNPGGIDPNLNPNGLDPNGLNPDGLNPDGTRLANADPNAFRPPAIPDVQTPGPGTVDPRNIGTGFRTGGGGAYPGGAAVPESLGMGRGPGGTAGGLPFLPFAPMGGGVGNDGERERGSDTALPEDESTWLGDDDIAPPVIGMEEER
jgi:hypothetical protein